MPSNENFFGVGTSRNNRFDRGDLSGNNSICSRSSNSSTPRISPMNSRHNSPVMTPLSTSPPLTTSPIWLMKRNFSGNTFSLIPEDRAVHATSQIFNKNFKLTKDSRDTYKPQHNILVRLILWWPLLMLSLFYTMLTGLLRVLKKPFIFAAPTFWLSACLWIFWKMIGFPLACFKWILTLLHTPSSERNRKKRTVLISCGSTIQTLHLARNFYSSGARVVVFEFEGLFALARFSTAVSKFYTIPKVTPDTAIDYINALCNIVEKERPSYFLPVSATSPAQYDALAKPHLELLGCISFIPGTQEVSIFDDIKEYMKKCRQVGIPLPSHQIISSKEELFQLYDNGWTGNYRNLMLATGVLALFERIKFQLPTSKRDLRLNYDINSDQVWIIMRDIPGVQYLTCTTIKNTKIIANVTCSIQDNTKSLIPDNNTEIDKWLENFFTQIRFQRSINGHISFRFVKCQQTGALYPLGARIGVSLPYICHTGVHPRVLWKPCPHFSRKNSGPLVQEGGRYWIHEAVMNTLKHPTVDAVSRLIGNVLNKREALFVYWDPLPYCAYYHFQLPIKSIKQFLQRRQANRRTILTPAPVH